MYRLVLISALCAIAYGSRVTMPLGMVPPMTVSINRDYGKNCIAKCFDVPSTSSINNVMPCVTDCLNMIAADIREWMEKFPDITDIKSKLHQPTTYNQLYNDGMVLQNHLLALQRMTETPGGLWDTLFPNFPGFGIFRPPTMQQGFQAQPQYPGLIMQVVQTVTNLLSQVIKKQQEILQLIIGCSCGNESTPAPIVPVMTTAAPVTTMKPATTVRIIPVVPNIVPEVSPVVSDVVVPEVEEVETVVTETMM